MSKREEIKIVIELSDNELKIVTESELQKMESDAIKFDGFEGWIVRGRLAPFKKTETIKFDELLKFINQKTGRPFKVINKDVRRKYNARLKDGYTRQDFANAIINACKSDYHKENGFQHLTPEFFSRANTLDKYAFVVNSSTQTKSKPQEAYNNTIPVE